MNNCPECGTPWNNHSTACTPPTVPIQRGWRPAIAVFRDALTKLAEGTWTESTVQQIAQEALEYEKSHQ